MGVIYKITSPTGRLYIGKTYNLEKRIIEYRHHIKIRRYNTPLFHSFYKYGWNEHLLEIIEEVDDAKMEEREIFWISELKTYRSINPNGMNLTKGGEGHRGTWMHDLERRKKQSEYLKSVGGIMRGKKMPEHITKRNAIKTSERNKRLRITVPKWGAEKGRLIVMKPIVAYNNNGEIIGLYPSLTQCAKELNIRRSGITDSLAYGSWHIGKYIFKYVSENPPDKIEVGKIDVKTGRRPVLFLNDEFEIMAEYPSALEASIELQVPKTTINRAAMYNWLWPIRTGHVFIYKDLYESLKEKEIV